MNTFLEILGAASLCAILGAVWLALEYLFRLSLFSGGSWALRIARTVAMSAWLVSTVIVIIFTWERLS